LLGEARVGARVLDHGRGILRCRWRRLRELYRWCECEGKTEDRTTRIDA
jgi:hypothetical protein